jgi:hypothetical protein
MAGHVQLRGMRTTVVPVTGAGCSPQLQASAAWPSHPPIAYSLHPASAPHCTQSACACAAGQLKQTDTTRHTDYTTTAVTFIYMAARQRLAQGQA